MTTDAEYGRIYKYTAKGSGKAYIGQTRQPLRRRAGRSGRNYLRACTKFANAIKKFGWNHFEVEVLLDNVHIDQLDHYEALFISAFDTYRNGYNCTEGGDTNPMCNVETVEKLLAVKKRKREERGIEDGVTKICSNPDCIHGGALQSVACFYRSKNTYDGCQSRCKVCSSSTNTINAKIQDRKKTIRKRKANRGLTDFTALYAADERLQELLRQRDQRRARLKKK